MVILQIHIRLNTHVYIVNTTYKIRIQRVWTLPLTKLKKKKKLYGCSRFMKKLTTVFLLKRPFLE